MENLTPDKLIIGLYKYMTKNDLKLSHNMQTYLCGMIDRSFNPGNSRMPTQQYVITKDEFDFKKDSIREKIQNVDDEKIVAEGILEGYYTFKYSGEFHVMLPILKEELPKEIEFPQACFSTAGSFAHLMKYDEESQIFDIFSISLDKYVDILHGYVKEINNGNINITTEDYKGFKNYIMEKMAKESKIINNPKIETEDSDDIIM